MQIPAPPVAACGESGLMGRFTFLITSPTTTPLGKNPSSLVGWSPSLQFPASVSDPTKTEITSG
ncbi:hypothetical protein LDENG_00166100 [Lucifuga dentata]|nr:hypothetical protein LDENG_00166100 [Lucifuga dentata]